MEVKKRAAAIATLCIMLLIMSVPSKQQVAAMSFCDCYQQCHDGCRHSLLVALQLRRRRLGHHRRMHHGQQHRLHLRPVGGADL